jgi:hypothetical protein
MLLVFGCRIAPSFAMTMILSLLTRMPEASGLFLMGTVFILVGLVLRRVLYASQKTLQANPKEAPLGMPGSIELKPDKALGMSATPHF